MGRNDKYRGGGGYGARRTLSTPISLNETSLGPRGGARTSGSTPRRSARVSLHPETGFYQGLELTFGLAGIEDDIASEQH